MNLEKPQIMVRELKHTNTPAYRLTCRLFGHKYKMTKMYKSKHREYECCNCKSQFTLDEYGTYTPLTTKLRHMNEVMEKLYLKKLSRQQA